jgi:hypothetical protein
MTIHAIQHRIGDDARGHLSASRARFPEVRVEVGVSVKLGGIARKVEERSRTRHWDRKNPTAELCRLDALQELPYHRDRGELVPMDQTDYPKRRTLPCAFDLVKNDLEVVAKDRLGDSKTFDHCFWQS